MASTLTQVGQLLAASACGLYFLYKIRYRTARRNQRMLQLEAARKDAEAHKMDGVGVSQRVLRKAETVLTRRTDRLSIVIERSTNSQNYTAVLRTAEALGVQNVYLISPPGWKQNNARRKKNRFAADDEEWQNHVAYAKQAQKWLTIQVFKTSQECIDELRRTGHTIWVTDLSQRAEKLLRTANGVAFPSKKMALVIGTESTGASDVMLKAADRRVYIPMNGFADSLNLSVAAALSIYHIFFIYPEIIGDFNAKNLQALRVAWYDTLARNDKEKVEYSRMALQKPPVRPFDDLRRCDQHRTGWTSRKDKRNNLKAGFNVGIGH